MAIEEEADDDVEAGDTAQGGAPAEDKRSNSDLFRELKTLFPTALLDTYHNGAWKREHLIVDIELLQVHRKEAGAPDPTPCGEIPELAEIDRRESRRPRSPVRRVPERPNRPDPGASSRMRPAQPPMPPSKKILADAAAQRSGMRAPLGAAPWPEDGAKMLKGFIDQWRLQPIRTKLLLSRLRPTQRTLVMRNFRPNDNGSGRMTQLEVYIKEHSQSGAVSTRKPARPISGGPDGTRDPLPRRPEGGTTPRTPPRALAPRTPPRTVPPTPPRAPHGSQAVRDRAAPIRPGASATSWANRDAKRPFESNANSSAESNKRPRPSDTVQASSKAAQPASHTASKAPSRPTSAPSKAGPRPAAVAVRSNPTSGVSTSAKSKPSSFDATPRMSAPGDLIKSLLF